MAGETVSVPRRTVLSGAALAAAWAGAAPAQPAPHSAPWPARQVRIIVPFAAGAAQDVFTRIIARRLSESMKVTIIVENRPGAGGYLGAQEVARAAPDGSPLLSASNSVSIIPSVQPQLGFDPRRSLAPLSLVCDVGGGLMVRQESPLRSLADLIAKARAKPNGLTYGSGGVGSANHLAGALLASMAGLTMVHVPFRGISQAVTAVYAGDIDFTFGSILELLSQARDGRARLLGMTTAARLPGLDDVPAVAEQVPGYASPNWFAFFAPAALPQPLVRRLAAELALLRDNADLKAILASGLAIARLDGPAPLAERLEADMTKWSSLVRQANIRAE